MHESSMGNCLKVCHVGLRAVLEGNAQRIIRGEIRGEVVECDGCAWELEAED
jgi:hypothetical protein